MKKLTGTSKKRVFRVLLLLLILAMTVSGCALPGTQSENPTEPIEEIRFTAETVAQLATIDSWYSLEVSVYGDKIYINNVLYEKIETVTNPEIVYDEELLTASQKTEDQAEYIAELLKKLKAYETCYMLEAEAYMESSKKVAIYEIDGTYYFVTTYNGVAYRIHIAVFE